jgi:hypothetical protein
MTMTYEEMRNTLQDVLSALQWGLREPKAGELMPVRNADELVDVVRRALASCEQPFGPLGVVLEGGLMSSVISDDKRLRGTEVVVIDYDVEGADESELIPVPQSTGDDSENSKAVISAFTVIPPGIDFAETCERFERACAAVEAGG